MLRIDKNLKILIVIGVISIVALTVFILRVQLEIESLLLTPSVQLYRQQASLIIDDGAENIQEVELTLGKDSTAFALLERATESLGLDLQTKVYEDMGIFIEAIGEKVNGQDGKYWLYYVNGKMPMVASDRQIIQNGDRVEFRFEPSPF